MADLCYNNVFQSTNAVCICLMLFEYVQPYSSSFSFSMISSVGPHENKNEIREITIFVISTRIMNDLI